jgi:hypothetical protein
MPLTYTIDSDRDVVFVRAEGKITDGDQISLARKISSDPKYHPSIRFFSDYTQVTQNALSPAALRQTPTIFKFSPTSRRATLVPARESESSVFLMYHAYCDIKNVSQPHVFRDRRKALDYLNEGVPPEKVIQ